MKQETSQEERRVVVVVEGRGAAEDGGPEVSLAEVTTGFELQPLPVLHALTDSDECSRSQQKSTSAKQRRLELEQMCQQS